VTLLALGARRKEQFRNKFKISLSLRESRASGEERGEPALPDRYGARTLSRGARVKVMRLRNLFLN
jgi:hypothetical protein